MTAPPSVRLAEHRKLITSTGKFWVDGKLLGNGEWLSGPRFIVFVSAWGNKWWVGVLTDGGMNTASTNTKEEAKTISPTHYEKFAGIDADAPEADIRLNENKKLIMTTGQFYVSGKLLGYGQWKPEGKFVVFVSAWGNKWWVGVLTNGGMNAASTTTEEGTQTITPTHFEKFSVPFADAPEADIHLTPNHKTINPYGEFYVNGALLGQGKWEPEGKFLVFVESWGSIWWLGNIVTGGMNTATFNTEAEAETGTPTHFEPFA